MKRVNNVNVSILKECRENMALDIETVREKVKTPVDKIEAGEQKPTFKQLEDLANLYQVPDWVFITDELPQKYRFSSLPTFRKFSKDNNFNDFELRRLVSKVEQFRNITLEFKEHMQEVIPKFSPPHNVRNSTDNPTKMADAVRSWLRLEEPLDFESLRSRLEEQYIFVFMTSKYNHWSKISEKLLFRGLAIFQETLPIIIINDSDAKKALSFTLFHELGHLLTKQSDLDIETSQSGKEDTRFDYFAGSVLMPKDIFTEKAGDASFNFLSEVKALAEEMKVSASACNVRLRQLKMIRQEEYEAFEKELSKKSHIKGFAPRKYRHREVRRQFGEIYTRTVWQAYYNEVIGLHRLCKLFGLRKVDKAWEMEKEMEMEKIL